MSHDEHANQDRRSEEDRSSDERLRALLPSYTVPEPSADFVADTLLAVSVDQYRIPEPSADFVDRVLERVLAEARGTGGSDAEPAREELLPVIDLSRHAVSEVTGPSRSRRFPLAMAIVGLAAALLLAFWVGRRSVSRPEISDQALVRIDDFPLRGSNRFARSLSLVVDRVDSRFDGEAARQDSGTAGSPAWPKPVLSLPAPPTNLIPSAAMDACVDQATLQSLGMETQNL